MKKQSLFGYLASRFSEHPENLATESLNYIINRSSVAKQAFLGYVAQTTVECPDDLTFRTQVGGGDSVVPDLVGTDTEGHQVVIVEAKFWAGLTENQPIVYLKRLPEHKNGVLFFIAPAMRFQTLWPELLRRCEDSDVSIHQVSRVGSEFLVGHITTNQVLALASWRSVLSFILRTLDAAGQTEVASDVLQLQGLCESMDSDAFLPIRSEELTSTIGRRVHQYCLLVDDVTALLKKERLASTKGLRATGSLGWYGRYMAIHRFACLLQFNSMLWSKYRETPLWLNLQGKDWKFSPSVRQYLSALEMEEPPRLLRHGDWFAVPLYLPTGVERGEVIESLLAQVREVAGYLKPHSDGD